MSDERMNGKDLRLKKTFRDAHRDSTRIHPFCGVGEMNRDGWGVVSEVMGKLVVVMSERAPVLLVIYGDECTLYTLPLSMTPHKSISC